MKFTFNILALAVLSAHVEAAQIKEGQACFVEWNANSNKYVAYGDKCKQSDKLDCNYHVADNNYSQDEPIAGICSKGTCLGNNDGDVPGEGTKRVTICHRTCSTNNPWVRITIDDDAWSGSGCGHQLEHDVLEDCSDKDGDGYAAWGANKKDYLIKDHGTRDQVRSMLEEIHGYAPGDLGTNSAIEKAYWKYWEPACPYVRRGACCDWDSGTCCGDDDTGVPPIVKEAGIMGDPHIKRFDRKKFLFNGMCDMVFVKTEQLTDFGKKMELHVRTNIVRWWSHVESAALKVHGFHIQMDSDKFYIDGSVASDSDLPYTSTGVTLEAPVSDAIMKNYTVTLSDKSSVVFSIIGAFVNVHLYGHKYDFNTAIGLVGNFEAGKPILRDGSRTYDLDEFVADYQVDSGKGDSLLFTSARAPQAHLGDTCQMPSVSEPTRNLRSGSVTPEFRKAAEEACADKGEEFDSCMYDVLNTGELRLAHVH